MEEVMAMQLIYEGKDITDAVEIKKADVTDNAGGQADSLELCFDDPKGYWSQWKPQKNHTVKVMEQGYDSGLMYVDELHQERGVFIIKALSIPQEAKTTNSKAWDNVRFMEFAGELAAKHGFELLSFGIQNHLYDRVDQNDQADFKHLWYRCMLEGYALKLVDKKTVIYSEPHIERQIPAKTVILEDMDGPFKFSSKSTGIFGACRVSYNGIGYEFRGGSLGPTLKINSIYVSSQAEAERYAKGLLRYRNKNEHIGYFTTALDIGIAGGNTLQISGIGQADGKYFCEQIIHKLKHKRTYHKVRKTLEGY